MTTHSVDVIFIAASTASEFRTHALLDPNSGRVQLCAAQAGDAGLPVDATSARIERVDGAVQSNIVPSADPLVYYMEQLAETAQYLPVRVRCVTLTEGGRAELTVAKLPAFSRVAIADYMVSTRLGCQTQGAQRRALRAQMLEGSVGTGVFFDDAHARSGVIVFHDQPSKVTKVFTAQALD